MTRNVLTIALTLVLAFVLGGHVVQACTCDAVMPQLGSGTSEVVAPVNNTVSVASWGTDCYVLYAPGRPPGTEDSTNFWRIHVRKTTETGWQETNGGNPINFYDGKTTQPYFYEAQLVVFQDHLYAVFSETDGDGLYPASGHKIVHVSKYDKDTDTWAFVDQAQTPTPPPAYARTGLSYPFYPGPDVWHWVYRTYNGVVATANALYVAWAEGLQTSGQLVVAKYDGTSWTYLPVTGPGLGTNMRFGSVGLGRHQGALVMVYQQDRPSYGDTILRVARFDESSQTWIRLSYPLNEVNPGSIAGPGLLAERNGELYVAWRERLAGEDQPSKLYVKKYEGGTTWTLVGTGPVHTSAQTLGLVDVLLGDAPEASAPVSDLTLVAWHEGKLYVDRFDGTAWQTVGTSGDINVETPFSAYMNAPTIGAASRVDGETYKYYIAWLRDATERPIDAVRLP